MGLNTASAVISFYSKLEDQAAKFYEDLARNEKYAEGRETFLAFARENKRHKEEVLRAYRQVITDALEACFFASLNESAYQVKTELTEDMSYSDVLKIAMELEERIYKFCIDAGKSSKSLLAGIPKAFERVAEIKAKRKLKLRSLYDKAWAREQRS